MRDIDDDMGELFRKASGDIRLRPAEDEWDLIKGRFLTESPLSTAKSKINSRFGQRSILIALLFTGIIMLIAIVQTRIQHTNRNMQQLPDTGKHDARTDPQIPYALSQAFKKTGKENTLKQNVDVSAFSDPENLISPYLQKSQDLSINDLLAINTVPEGSALTIQTAPNHIPFDGAILADKQSEKDRVTLAQKRFYAGVLAGPQFSETKNQGFRHAGLNAGFLLGFHITKKLAVEAGFFISDKQYSSAGEYFDISKISASMPSGMKLIQVNSNTRVIEIPVSLKYNVAGTGKSDLFISGGLSSYILTSEKNQYQASLNGTNETLRGNYFANQNYFAASIRASAGYEYKVSKSVKLRIEPYFQLPLKTIGMGSMHVQSTGINFGFTIP